MRGRAAIVGLICAAPLSAGAATLPIDGSYGNDLGCDLARTGQYNPVDGLQLLTAQDLSSSVTLCSFDAVEPAPGGRHHVAMTCASEGSGPEENYRETAEVSGNAHGGYTIRFGDGTSWGPLTRC